MPLFRTFPFYWYFLTNCATNRYRVPESLTKVLKRTKELAGRKGRQDFPTVSRLKPTPKQIQRNPAGRLCCSLRGFACNNTL